MRVRLRLRLEHHIGHVAYLALLLPRRRRARPAAAAGTALLVRCALGTRLLGGRAASAASAPLRRHDRLERPSESQNLEGV